LTVRCGALYSSFQAWKLAPEFCKAVLPKESLGSRRADARCDKAVPSAELPLARDQALAHR
jgi:hypothetical protein